MGKKNHNPPELFINRELSWLEFNDRVMREGLSDELPLLERLKFLAITASNLDEFFMIRVAGLVQQRAAGVRRRGGRRDDVEAAIGGNPPPRSRDGLRAHRRRSSGARRVGRQRDRRSLIPMTGRVTTSRSCGRILLREVLPVLTPLAIQALKPAPLLPGLQLHLALVIRSTSSDEAEEKIAVVPVPSQFSRFVSLPSQERLEMARLEDAIAANVAELFPGHEVLAVALFRITRDADVAIQDDDASDLLNAVEEAVLDRRRRGAVRLEISADPIRD